MTIPALAEGSPPLYHGTRTGFRGRGGLLLPRTEHGGPGTTAPVNHGREQVADADSHVYVTTDPLVAWVYAWCAPGRRRPRVLTVRPFGQPEPDPEHGPEMSAYRCEAATVLAVAYEPLCTEEEAHAGWQTGLGSRA